MIAKAAEPVFDRRASGTRAGSAIRWSRRRIDRAGIVCPVIHTGVDVPGDRSNRWQWQVLTMPPNPPLTKRVRVISGDRNDSLNVVKNAVLN